MQCCSGREPALLDAAEEEEEEEPGLEESRVSEDDYTLRSQSLEYVIDPRKRRRMNSDY